METGAQSSCQRYTPNGNHPSEHLMTETGGAGRGDDQGKTEMSFASHIYMRWLLWVARALERAKAKSGNGLNTSFSLWFQPHVSSDNQKTLALLLGRWTNAAILLQ